MESTILTVASNVKHVHRGFTEKNKKKNPTPAHTG